MTFTLVVVLFNVVDTIYYSHFLFIMIGPYSYHDAASFEHDPFYTVMVFNDCKNDNAVAFFIISRTREQHLCPILQTLHHMV